MTNTAYSFGAKNYALVDITILALGYVLRVYYGALLIHVPVSSWLFLTILSTAFFLGLGKRRNELETAKDLETREVLKKYTKNFLDKVLYMCLTLSIVFYSLWCAAMSQSEDGNLFLFTVPVVLLICMRYCMDIEGDSDGDPVEVVLSDKMLLCLIGVYALMIVLFLYGGKFFGAIG